MIEDFYARASESTTPIASDLAALCSALAVAPDELGQWLGMDTSGVVSCGVCNGYHARGADCQSKLIRESIAIWLEGNREAYDARHTAERIQARRNRLNDWRRRNPEKTRAARRRYIAKAKRKVEV